MPCPCPLSSFPAWAVSPGRSLHPCAHPKCPRGPRIPQGVGGPSQGGTGCQPCSAPTNGVGWGSPAARGINLSQNPPDPKSLGDPDPSQHREQQLRDPHPSNPTNGGLPATPQPGTVIPTPQTPIPTPRGQRGFAGSRFGAAQLPLGGISSDSPRGGENPPGSGGFTLRL